MSGQPTGCACDPDENYLCDLHAKCGHNHSGYCFDCVRERHNQEVLDGKYDDFDDEDDAYAITPHPSVYYDR